LPSKHNNSELARYAGLATELLVALGLSVFGGIKLDAWIGFKIPLLVWLLPLLVLAVMMYRLIRSTSKKK
jgi:hypothetical protein